jgi:hypothetical protein
MGFRPRVAGDLHRADGRIYSTGAMGLAVDFAAEATPSAVPVG